MATLTDARSGDSFRDPAPPTLPGEAGGRLDAVAHRVAERVRAEVLPRLRTLLDTPAFRHQGGTDQTLNLVAGLALGRFLYPFHAAVAVGHEFGITVPDDDDVARAQAIERIESTLGRLVTRVYELARTAGPSDHDHDRELAQLLAERAQARVGSRRGARLDAQASSDLRRPMLVDLLGQALSVPRSSRYLLREHPALDHAMTLVGAAIDPVTDEIERWRPRLRFDGLTEQCAQRIAADARQSSDPDGLAAAAANRLGASISDLRYHPAVLRAEQLMPELTGSYDVLIRDHGMKPQDAANEIITGIQRAAQAADPAAAPVTLRGTPRRLPCRPAPFEPVTLEVLYLSGLPGLSATNQSRWLLITNSGIELFANLRARRPLAMLEYAKLGRVCLGDPNAIPLCEMAPRRAFRPLAALAERRAGKPVRLIAEPCEDMDVVFEVFGHTPAELEAALSPLAWWLQETQGRSSVRFC